MGKSRAIQLSGSVALKVDDIRAHLELVQIIRPELHHGFAFFEELGAVIGGAKGIRHLVRQLMFNDFGLLSVKCPGTCPRTGVFPCQPIYI